MSSGCDCAHLTCWPPQTHSAKRRLPAAPAVLSVSAPRPLVSGVVIWGLIPETVEQSGETVEVPHSPLESRLYFPFHSDLCTEAACEDYEN